MEFTATDEQARQIACNAINASAPAGLGFLHAKVKTYEPADVEIHDGSIQMDYFEGRMVKLSLHKSNDGKWTIRRGAEPQPDYQSWATAYPTAQALVASVIPA